MESRAMNVAIALLIILPLLGGFSGFSFQGLVSGGVQDVDSGVEGEGDTSESDLSVDSACSGSLSASDLGDCLRAIADSFNVDDPLGALNVLANTELIVEALSDVLGSLEDVPGVPEISEPLDDVANTIGDIIDTFVDLVSIPYEILDILTTTAEDLLGGFVDVINGTIEWMDGLLSNPLQGIVDSIDSFFQGINDSIPEA